MKNVFSQQTYFTLVNITVVILINVLQYSQLMNRQADINCSSRCTEQGITYVRLNPPLNETVDSGEKDNDKLLNMLWTTRQYLHTAQDENKRNKMDLLINALQQMYPVDSI